MARILVVDDDSLSRTLLHRSLVQNGHRVLEAGDGESALAMVGREKPDLVVLDIVMPGISGLEFCRELRRAGNALPILMLTSRNRVEDRVEGLRLGADDYLAKPYDHRELLARVEALLRRQHEHETTHTLLEVAGVRIDLREKRATRNGKEVPLTKTEWHLLELLARHPGETVTRENMLDAVWGYTYMPSTRTVDTHIWRLRRKLGMATAIRNIHGAGYQLRPEKAA